MSLFLLPTADGRTARNHPSRSLPTSPEWVGLHLRTPLPASSVRGRDGWRVRCGVLVSETVFLILCVCFVLSVEMTSGKQYPRSSVEFYTRKLHDKEKGTYMGRSPTSWAKIGLFYLVFYGMLAALVAICMWVFLQTLDPRIPKWQQESSIIGTNPGLGFRPMPKNNEESTLIWLEGTNKANYLNWYDNIMEFLDKYYTPGKIEKGNAYLKTCSYTELASPTEVCEVDVKDWGDCSRDQFFNYYRSSPCIFLKLNKIYGWTPDYYDDPNDLPADMPKNLKEHIRNITRPEERKNIWVSCEGENPADVEYLGPIKFYPSVQGFPGYYFPFRNSEGYLSPLVAVRFMRPVSGIVINIECRAWAKNIRYNRADRMGSVHFELLID